MTSREAAILACGIRAVQSYERVKSFYTKFGLAIEVEFADEVGGYRSPRGEGGPDVVTHLGGFEFCASENSKNSAGEKAQRERVPAGHVVQATGPLRKGRIAGQDFLRLHGIHEPHRAAGECLLRAAERASA